jgi:PAS domain S-box-containing protein
MNDHSPQPELRLNTASQRLASLRQQAAAVAIASGPQAGLDALDAGLEEIQRVLLAPPSASPARPPAESATEEYRDRLQTIFQALSLPIIVLDLQGLVRMWNLAAEKTFGWTAAEVEGQEPPFVPAEGREAHRLWITHVLGGETLHGGDLKRCQTKDGSALEFRLSAAPLHGPGGVVNGLAAMYLDITEKANLEAQLLRAQRIESIGHLAGGIAHDLNNILSPMMMAAPLLRDEISTPAGLALLRAVEHSAKRGSEIVKQVLGFARGLKADKVPVQTRHLLRETVEIMQQTFPKSIRVKISFPRELWLVEGNGTHLHQVLMNLCINARDAMPDGGTLTLLAENLNVDAAMSSQVPEAHPGPYVVWTVADTGNGIAPENLARIFEPFFTTKPVGSGSGLGLHTVATILRNHGGFAQVKSQLGQGTTFKVFLPALPEAHSAEAASAATVARGHGECVLVVDDEDNIRTLLRALLERHGYRVLLAASGQEALALWPHHPEIQLVIMDLMMTGMSGFQLTRVLRGISPQLKVVVNTGVTDEKILSELLPLQVNAVLFKPAEITHLLATLDHVLTAAPAAP